MNERTYQVEFMARAISDLDGLDKENVQRVMKRLRWAAENFASLRPEGLTGQLAGLFKFRVGDYRVIYELDRKNKILTVHMVGHRRKIYKIR